MIFFYISRKLKKNGIVDYFNLYSATDYWTIVNWGYMKRPFIKKLALEKAFQEKWNRGPKTPKWPR